jgi:DNA polymerase
MRSVAIENNFASWRIAARGLLEENVAPDEIIWTSGEQASLFNEGGKGTGRGFAVPRSFLKLAADAACYDDDAKWPLLYRILFRIKHEDRNLLSIESDEDMRHALMMQKAVKRDIHKFHAFVRFRTVDVDGEEIYTAWHEPQHWTVEEATPFFARRFGAMRWSILTPKGCAHWDLKELTFSPAVTRDHAPQEDATEEFWLTYYRSIFNPFRLSLKTMKQEMPVRHWQTLPEAALIREMVRETNAWTPDANARGNKRQSTKLPR